MRQLTIRESLREALFEEMQCDPAVWLLGEDSQDPMGGSYKVTLDLSSQLGPDVSAMPPSQRPRSSALELVRLLPGVVRWWKLCTWTFLRSRWTSWSAKQPKYDTCLADRSRSLWWCVAKARRAAAAQHSQQLEAWFAHVPWLKVIMSATPRDARGY